MYVDDIYVFIIGEVVYMLAAMQGVVKGDCVISDVSDLRRFDGRMVTIIVNDLDSNQLTSSSFIEDDIYVTATGIDADSYVRELRTNERL